MEKLENFLEIKVEEAWHDLRLDIFLSRILDDIPSRAFALKLIENGLVWVNDRTRKPSFKVTENDIVKIDLSFSGQSNKDPAAEDIPLSILFEDKDILVIDKPAGLVVHPGAGVSAGTLVNAVLGHCGMTLPSLGETSRAGIVHRLDKDTSGVMVVAKSQVALTKLSLQFAEHKQERFYYALVYGVPKEKQGRIETWHGRHPKNRIKYAVVPEGQGKKAILNYYVEKSFEKLNISLVKCQLYTGRTHQIRVQMAFLGHPILGDLLYGHAPQHFFPQKKDLIAFLNQAALRQMLHAFHLGFIHPVLEEKREFQAPLPSDFQELLNFLESKNVSF